MGNPLQTELEALASQLVHRRWVARAALVTDGGEVAAMYSSRVPAERDAAADAPRAAAGGPIDVVGGVARMVVERLDEQTWIYVDLGLMRLVARLSRATYAPAATTWLARELGRIGFTVERETLAQD